MLVDRMQHLAEKLTGLHQRFGDPVYKHIAVAYKAETYAPSVPMRVEQINPRRIGDFLSDTVQAYGDELLVWVPRHATENTIANGTYTIAGSTVCDVLHVDRNDPIWWVVTLKPRRNR
jgi:hypothetical protein